MGAEGARPYLVKHTLRTYLSGVADDEPFTKLTLCTGLVWI